MTSLEISLAPTSSRASLQSRFPAPANAGGSTALTSALALRRSARLGGRRPATSPTRAPLRPNTARIHALPKATIVAAGPLTAAGRRRAASAPARRPSAATLRQGKAKGKLGARPATAKAAPPFKATPKSTPKSTSKPKPKPKQRRSKASPPHKRMTNEDGTTNTRYWDSYAVDYEEEIMDTMSLSRSKGQLARAVKSCCEQLRRAQVPKDARPLRALDAGCGIGTPVTTPPGS